MKVGDRSVSLAVGWPRVQILQRASAEAGWRVLKVLFVKMHSFTTNNHYVACTQTLTPLLNVAATEDTKGAESEPVQSCSLDVRLDPATGSIGATQTKGSTVSQAGSVFWGRVQLAFALVAPFVLLALFVYRGYFFDWYETRQHTAWLVDFYQKNAPEVSICLVSFLIHFTHGFVSFLFVCRNSKTQNTWRARYSSTRDACFSCGGDWSARTM